MKYGRVTLGQIEALINKLGGEEGVKRLLSDETEVVVKHHIIDCDADPITSEEGWSVEQHSKGGRFCWEPDKVDLYLCNEQKRGLIVGHELRKRLGGLPVLNVKVLEYLLDNPQLIPTDWRWNPVFFWGTIFRGPDGNLYVRCLIAKRSRASSFCRRLDEDFDGSTLAVIFAHN